MSVNIWEHFFKPEARSSGLTLLNKNKVAQSCLSDTEIQTYIQVSGSIKVILKVDSVESKTIKASCPCPQSKKGQFCKHIWAALLATQQKFPDFLDSKIDLENKSEFETNIASKNAAYLKAQSDYRKLQYQKQKQQIKNLKLKNKKSLNSETFPEDVEASLKYFSENGFVLRPSLTKETVAVAIKKLSRVFHPDMGGSHTEIVELNKHAEVLTKFLKD